MIGKIENPENDINNILAYNTIRNSYSAVSTSSYNFRHTYGSSDIYDQPAYFIFKLIFYFDDAAGSEGDVFEGGLLGGVTASSEEEADDTSKYETASGNNSALYFLLANGEYERAEYLNTFLELLSDINVKSPWYFQTLTGLAEGLQQHKDGKWKIDESVLPPYKLEIGLLQDSLDTRIGTMLDAYRSACFSATMKKEIVPANLRKFNMGIYIASTPIASLHRDKTIGGSMGSDSQLPKNTVSYKYFELRGCEIDATESYSTENISNATPFNMTHKLVIRYSSIYEESYNHIMGKLITDNIITDTVKNAKVTKDQANKIVNQKTVEQTQRSGFLTNAARQLVAFGTDKVTSAIKRLYLGNIYTVSGKRLLEQSSDILNGNVLGGIRTVSDYVRTAQTTKMSPNIFYGDAKGTVDQFSLNPTVRTAGSTSNKQELGNIYQSKKQDSMNQSIRNGI